MSLFTDQDANVVVLEIAVRSVGRIDFTDASIPEEDKLKLAEARDRLAARLRENLAYAKRQ